jgi:hypothetical protein
MPSTPSHHPNFSVDSEALLVSTISCQHRGYRQTLPSPTIRHSSAYRDLHGRALRKLGHSGHRS